MKGIHQRLSVMVQRRALCLSLMLIVYKILRSSLLFFVSKTGQTHEVAIKIISAFPSTSLPVASVLTNVTNDYTCTRL